MGQVPLGRILLCGSVDDDFDLSRGGPLPAIGPIRCAGELSVFHSHADFADRYDGRRDRHVVEHERPPRAIRYRHYRPAGRACAHDYFLRVGAALFRSNACIARAAYLFWSASIVPIYGSLHNRRTAAWILHRSSSHGVCRLGRAVDNLAQPDTHRPVRRRACFLRFVVEKIASRYALDSRPRRVGVALHGPRVWQPGLGADDCASVRDGSQASAHGK